MGIHFDNSRDWKKCSKSNSYSMVINLPLGNLRHQMVPIVRIAYFLSWLKLRLTAICESHNQFSLPNMTQLLIWPECFFISSPQNWIILKLSTSSYHDHIVMTVPICCGYGNYANATTTSDTGCYRYSEWSYITIIQFVYGAHNLCPNA